MKARRMRGNSVGSIMRAVLRRGGPGGRLLRKRRLRKKRAKYLLELRREWPISRMRFARLETTTWD